MNTNTNNLKQSIEVQRRMLGQLIGDTMKELSKRCSGIMNDKQKLEALMRDSCPHFSYCKHLYILDKKGVQITDNITQFGPDSAYMARDRSERPYMLEIMQHPNELDFSLSEAYISSNQKRPSLTAIHAIYNDSDDKNRQLLGYLGADFDIRELPRSESGYKEPDFWRQIKGDPAIRGGLFQQHRAESIMDTRMDEVLAVMHELMSEQGVYHGKFHFSSSRCTLWQIDDPLSYRILNIDELTDPDICLAFPKHPYPERAIVPKETILAVFDMFRELRFADENIYLRSGSLNIINGLVGLNFSCDGSHYIPHQEFLEKNTAFWFGAAGKKTVTQPTS